MEQVEDLFKKIYNENSKNYFKEVLVSYQNENYRSAVVMLYSVVIADVVYKLKYMESVYGDEKAIKILDEIKEQQRKNSKSPEWENNIIKSVKENTNLIDNVVEENIRHLKKHRHLAAHPILDNDRDLLISPNRDDVIAHMRNMLEGVLIKPPIFTKNIVHQLLEGLDQNKEHLLLDKKRLEKYLEQNFYRYLDNKFVLKIFKALWKITFSLDNDQAKENRTINSMTIESAFKRFKEQITQDIQGDIQQYSKNITYEGDRFDLFVKFLVTNDVYKYLEDLTQESIKSNISENSRLLFISHFLSGSLKEHIDYLKKQNDSNNSTDLKFHLVSKADTILMFEIYAYEGFKKVYLDLLINIFKNSTSYDNANNNFNSFVQPFLNEFTDEQIIQIIQGFNNNSQISGRNHGKYDLELVIKEIEKRGQTLELDDYSVIKNMIG